MERVLVSACLLGEAVRYDGRDRRVAHPTLERWIAEGRVVPICPEVAGGLSVPRKPAEIQRGGGGSPRVVDAGGEDVTSQFERGASEALVLARAHGIRVAVLKERSPSCGSGMTYDGTFTGTLVPHAGVTAAALRAAGILVFNEDEMEEAARVLMRVEPLIRPYTPADLESLRALLTAPGIREQFDTLQGEGALEGELEDEQLDPEGIHLAFASDAPAGFAFAYVMPQGGAGWAMVRVGVAPAHRRRGIGEQLLLQMIRFCAAQRRVPDVRCVSIAAWAPHEEMTGLAAKLGFVEERRMWMLERPRRPVVPLAWPDGVVVRTFDGSERDVEAWSEIHNRSFAEHWRFVPTTANDCRGISRIPAFRPEGLALAWRDGRCVGYSGALLFENRGEIAVLGTAPEARGIGLGRALLRRGVEWLQGNTEHPITLVVDGENEGALQLYRSEGFVTMRERRIWQLPSNRLTALLAR